MAPCCGVAQPVHVWAGARRWGWATAWQSWPAPSAAVRPLRLQASCGCGTAPCERLPSGGTGAAAPSPRGAKQRPAAAAAAAPEGGPSHDGARAAREKRRQKQRRSQAAAEGRRGEHRAGAPVLCVAVGSRLDKTAGGAGPLTCLPPMHMQESLPTVALAHCGACAACAHARLQGPSFIPSTHTLELHTAQKIKASADGRAGRQHIPCQHAPTAPSRATALSRVPPLRRCHRAWLPEAPAPG